MTSVNFLSMSWRSLTDRLSFLSMAAGHAATSPLVEREAAHWRPLRDRVVL